MKENGFHASNSGGKKALAISLIVALVLAAISVIGAFAAPTTKTGSSTNRENELRELNVDRAWFNNVKANRFSLVTSSDPVEAQQYLNQYAFALTQAETLIRNGSVTATNHRSNNNNGSNNGNNQSKAQINGLTLGDWLHQLRGLRQKLEGIGVKANGNFMNNVAGGGVPVTGGSSSSSSSTGSSAAPSATPTTGSSSSSSSAATPTATPTTSSSSSSSSTGSSATPSATPTTGSSSSSSSSATPSATPTTSSSSSSSSSSSTSGAAIPNTGSQNNNVSNATLAKVWGIQFRSLEADRVWFNNFRSNVANLVTSDPAKTQQWLSQYAFALRQADAIIASGTSTVMNNSNNNNNSLSNGNSQRTSAQKDLAMWLHMMRDLQIKLTGGTVNGTTSTTP